VAGKIRQATALRRYFLYQGLTFYACYAWTSDQCSQYSTKVAPGHLVPRIKGMIRQDFILRHWDDLLRLPGSLKLGWVTASLFISKLQAYPR
jgi:TnpA family transposase